MKKFIMALVLMPLMALAGTEKIGDVTWSFTVANGEATVTGASPVSGVLEIPSTLGGCPVTSIGEFAVYYCTSLTSVTIPEGVTSIGEWAFSHCHGLTSVTIPSSVMGIGNCAFRGCSGLTSVTIPSSVTSIGHSAFRECSKLTEIVVATGNPSYCSVEGILYNKSKSVLIQCPGNKEGSVTIPSSVTSIGLGAFEYCHGLTSVTIPSSVTSIGGSAFYGCSGLTSVTIPSGVTEIEDWTFARCSGLTSVTIPSSVTKVGRSAFDGCYGLTYVSISSCITKISTTFQSAYQNIREVVVLDGVTKISDHMFDGCVALTAVKIPSSVTSIGDCAFYNCYGLGSVTIPSSVQSIGSYAFYGTKLLEDHPDGLVIVENCLVDYKGSGPCGPWTIEIPNGVRLIAGSALSHCSGLTSVTIPNSVIHIGNYAFEWCEWLTSVTIPDSVESIGDHAFEECEQLVSVTICKRETASGVEPRIGSFVFNHCNSLSVVFVDDEPTGWVKRCFGDTVIYQKIGTPVENVFEFSCANNEATVIGVQPGLGEVVIPQTTDGVVVTRIGNAAFKCRAGLTSVVIPSSVLSIGSGAFYGCAGLESISVDPASESFKVVNGCLMSKDGMTLVRGPAQSAVTIPDGVKSISSFAFESCGSLKSIAIPSSVTDIGEAAFQKCYALDSITIHKSVSYVGFVAFAQCNNLTTVYVDVGDTYRVKQMLERSDGIDVCLLNFVEQGDLPEIEPVVTNTITYLNMQGSANPNPATFTAKDLPLTLTPLTRDGYEFLGWTPNGGVIPVGTVTNVTFTANWEKVIEPPPVEPPEESEVNPWQEDGAFSAAVANTYDGYLIDEDYNLLGVVQVKTTKQNSKGVVTATATVTDANGKKWSYSKGEVTVEGVVTGLKCTTKGCPVAEFGVKVGMNGMEGAWGEHAIFGARNVFSAKDAASKTAAAAIEKKWIGAVNVVGDGVVLGVTVVKKGKVKVAGTVNGAKVSATSQLLVGAEACCVPVIITKKANLAFNLWLTDDGEIVVRGAEGLIADKAGALQGGAEFCMNGVALARALPGLLVGYLPDGLSVSQSGSKWVVAGGAKAGKLTLVKGTSDIDLAKSKLTDNMSGLKLTYKQKDGSFKGSFKAYAVENGKLKSYTVIVTGVMVGDTGYGIASLKKASVEFPVVIE